MIPLIFRYSSVDFLNADWTFILLVTCLIVVILVWLIIHKKNEESLIKIKTTIFTSKNFGYFDKVLIQYFPYYQSLNVDLKRKFVSRLVVFLELKAFIPRQTEKNEILNILISATATQLTFGLKDFGLFSFDKILIYPDAYYSEIRKQHHKGEINVQQKLIVLSAKHFLQGIQVYNDGINLGLHEIAHALNINEFENGNDEFINCFKDWEILARQEMPKILADDNHFIRNYAATNIQEMFAVCTEYFFEKPELFLEKLPNLYKNMCQLYKQNPLNREKPLLKPIVNIK